MEAQPYRITQSMVCWIHEQVCQDCHQNFMFSHAQLAAQSQVPTIGTKSKYAARACGNQSAGVCSILSMRTTVQSQRGQGGQRNPTISSTGGGSFHEPGGP